MNETPPESGPREHFTPPPAEPVTQREARSNFLLFLVLSGAGCIVVLLGGLLLAVLGALGGGAAER